MNQKVWVAYRVSDLGFVFRLQNSVLFAVSLERVSDRQGRKFDIRHTITVALSLSGLKDSAAIHAAVPRTPHEVAGEQEFRAVDRILASQFEAERSETLT